MKLGIFGLGYVGLTTAACLLRRGHEVIGYEVSDLKRAELAAGRCPLSEPGVEAVLAEALRNGRFSVAADISSDSLPDVVLICVGTPSAEDGSTDLTAVRGVFTRLAAVAAQADPATTMDVAVRSTMPPGSLALLEREYDQVFQRFSVVFFPEFLREGTAMADFDAPPQTVLGQPAGRRRPERLLQLLDELGLEVESVAPLSAEALKMACNAYHAVKVCFANEIGRVINTLGGDATEVMRLFVKDTVLNVSHRYLMPGAPYGGSCLPKDVRSISSVASRSGVPAEILAQCETSNASHLQYIVAEVLRHRPKVVGLLGLAFKPRTDDLRESPSLSLASSLLATGVKVVAHDFVIEPDRLTGVNRTALQGLLRRPGISLESDLTQVQQVAEVFVQMHHDARYDALKSSRGNRPWANVAGWSFVPKEP
jgi:GDP-mannose 6-dehydrogenase